MMNVLDLLKYRLASPGGGQVPGMSTQDPQAAMAAEMLERMRRDPSLIGSMNRMAGTPTPPRGTYGEADTIPSTVTQAGQPLFDQELAARLWGPQREEPLMQQLYGGRQLAKESVWPMPEGAVQSYSPQSPYSSPLNQLLRRGPFGQY